MFLDKHHVIIVTVHCCVVYAIYMIDVRKHSGGCFSLSLSLCVCVCARE
jgi:hypothetical protein